MIQRSEFHKALDELQKDILKMGSLVEENIAMSVDSLARQDLQLEIGRASCRVRV